MLARYARPVFALALLLLAGGLAGPALAQPDGAELLRRWAEGQRVAAEAVRHIDVREGVVLRVVGPFAEREIATAADARYYPDGEAPQRELREVRLDGRVVPPRRLREVERRLQRALGPAWAGARRLLHLPHRALLTLEPIGPAVEDEVDGRPAWRVALAARRADGPVERATLWFAATRAPRLLRSHVVVRPPSEGTRGHTRPPSADVRTDYATVRGLDLPARRSVEAFAHQRRRIRTYTVRLTADLTLADPVVVRRE